MHSYIKISYLENLYIATLFLVNGLSYIVLLYFINSSLASEQFVSREDVVKFGGLLVVGVIFGIAANRKMVNILESYLYETRLRFAKTVLSTEQITLEKIGSSRLWSVYLHDITTLSNAAFAIPKAIADLIILIAGISYLVYLSGAAFLYVVVYTSALVASYSLIRIKVGGFLKKDRESQDTLTKNIQSLIFGSKELKQNQALRELFYTHCVQRSALKVKKYSSSAFHFFSMAEVFAKTAFFLLIGLIVFASKGELGFFLIEIAQPELVSVITTLIFCLSFLLSFFAVIPALLEASVSQKKINSLNLNWRAINEIGLKNQFLQIGFSQKVRSIRFDGIAYSYSSDPLEADFCIDVAQLTINRGKVHFIIGGNGSGKTTLAKIIAGLYIPEAGSVVLNDKHKVDFLDQEYRDLFSCLWNESHVLEFTNEGHTLDDFESGFIDSLDIRSYVATGISAKEVSALSTGIKARLELAYTIKSVKDFIILDEWAANQSKKYKHFFYTEVLGYLREKGIGVVVISHDDEYFHLADCVYQVHSGKLTSV